jgi:hypothetical protein
MPGYQWCPAPLLFPFTMRIDKGQFGVESTGNSLQNEKSWELKKTFLFVSFLDIAGASKELHKKTGRNFLASFRKQNIRPLILYC